MLHDCTALARAGHVEILFGLSLDNEADAVIAKTGVIGHFTITSTRPASSRKQADGSTRDRSVGGRTVAAQPIFVFSDLVDQAPHASHLYVHDVHPCVGVRLAARFRVRRAVLATPVGQVGVVAGRIDADVGDEVVDACERGLAHELEVAPGAGTGEVTVGRTVLAGMRRGGGDSDRAAEKANGCRGSYRGVTSRRNMASSLPLGLSAAKVGAQHCGRQ